MDNLKILLQPLLTIC